MPSLESTHSGHAQHGGGAGLLLELGHVLGTGCAQVGSGHWPSRSSPSHRPPCPTAPRRGGLGQAAGAALTLSAAV
eukprot:3094509-Pyramimonas_sp.AAC.1